MAIINAEIRNTVTAFNARQPAAPNQAALDQLASDAGDWVEATLPRGLKYNGQRVCLRGDGAIMFEGRTVTRAQLEARLSGRNGGGADAQELRELVSGLAALFAQ